MAFLGGLLGNGLQAQAPGGAQPMGGLGQALSALRQNPGFLNGIAGGLVNGGNVPESMAIADEAVQKKLIQDQEVELRRQALAQDQSQFGQTFGLQSERLGMEKASLASDAQERRALQSATADFLEKNGADSSLVDMARAGQGATAFKMFQDMKGGNTEYGLQPVYGLDADGNTVIGQVGKNGTIIRSATPEGFNPLSPQGLTQQKATGTALGKSQGESAAALPGAEASASYALQKIDDVLQDPDLGSATGWQGALMSFPGTTKKNLDVKISQLKSQTFLQAFESLKGAGQITEVEGQKAEAAIARLDQAQGDEEFKSALVDLKSVIQTGLARSREKAGGAAQQPMGAPSGNKSSTGVSWSIEP